MSSSSRSSSENTIDVDELLQIRTRCRELRKEKENWRESQSQSFELIRIMELRVNSLAEAHVKDQKHIEKMERELMNCAQQIDYLQDQLNARNAEVNSLSEHVHGLELKLADKENSQEQVGYLREELRISDSKCLALMEELEIKEVKLQNSRYCIEKLEESMSSLSLESQCEIESMKLDILNLEQNYFEAKKMQERTAKMNELIQEHEKKFQDAEETIKYLGSENKDLLEKLLRSQLDAQVFFQKIKSWLENKAKTHNAGSYRLATLKEMRTSSGEDLNALFSKLAMVLSPDEDLKDQMENMSHQIHEYELLNKQLKDELIEQKLKAKEEAEDLEQEMAELRYQMTDLLEEERKRRVCIEQASLQRIARLEEQIKGEERKCLASIEHFSRV